MNFEVVVCDVRTRQPVARGEVISVDNQYASGPTRLLKLTLSTGYEIKLYLTLGEMRELLASFPTDENTVGLAQDQEVGDDQL